MSLVREIAFELHVSSFSVFLMCFPLVKEVFLSFIKWILVILFALRKTAGDGSFIKILGCLI